MKRMFVAMLSALLMFTGCGSAGDVSGSTDVGTGSVELSKGSADERSEMQDDMDSSVQLVIDESEAHEEEMQDMSVFDMKNINMNYSVVDRGNGLFVETNYKFPDIDYNDDHEVILDVTCLENIKIWSVAQCTRAISKADYDSGTVNVFYIDGNTLYVRRGNSDGITIIAYYPFDELTEGTRKVTLPSPGAFISGLPCTVSGDTMTYSYIVFDSEDAKLLPPPVLVGGSDKGTTEEVTYGGVPSINRHKFINEMGAPDINTGDDWVQIYGNEIEIEFKAVTGN